MNAKTENYGFGKSWSDLYIDEHEGRVPVMSDYHKHDYFEISLILSGEVRIFMPELSSVGRSARILLSPPGTPHYVTCTGSELYKRINIVFAKSLISEGVIPEILRTGAVIELDSEAAERFFSMIKAIEREEAREGRRILLSYLLFKIGEHSGKSAERAAPKYITRALEYIKEHCAERFTAAEVAASVGVGRTTLMTGFKAYLGTSIGEYITRHRVGVAAKLISHGESCARAAELAGFCESSGMIRAFKREFGMTPTGYLKALGGG